MSAYEDETPGWRWPRLSIARQFMLLLFVVLVIAQAINLVLLVGERQLVRQTDINDRVVVALEDILSDRPILSQRDLPYPIRNVRGLRGAFFYSDNNRVADFPRSKAQPRLAKRLMDRLSAQDSEILSTHATILRGGPEEKGRSGMGRPDGPPERIQRSGPPPDGDFRRRPPPPRGSDNPRYRPPPPPGGPSGPGHSAPGIQELLVSVELPDGIYLNAMVPYYPASRIAPRILLATAALLILTLLVGGFFIRRIAKPYGQLAQAAQRLGRGEARINLDETGPPDVRDAAIAFNRMQDRLTRLIEGQRMMLRAVSHDLRTPLTAMRIDVESVTDDELKGHLVASIEEMTGLTEDILGWAKDLSGSEDLAAINLQSFLQVLVEDYQRRGADIQIDIENPVTVRVRRVAFRRALRNLIDNGLRYGGQVSVRTQIHGDLVAIYIEDNGPGIPESDLPRVMTPFVRLEDSRNKETGGTGLGLSIAQSVIQAEGGELVLANREGGGLQVKVTVPR